MNFFLFFFLFRRDGESPSRTLQPSSPDPVHRQSPSGEDNDEDVRRPSPDVTFRDDLNLDIDEHVKFEDEMGEVVFSDEEGAERPHVKARLGPVDVSAEFEEEEAEGNSKPSVLERLGTKEKGQI